MRRGDRGGQFVNRDPQGPLLLPKRTRGGRTQWADLPKIPGSGR